MIELHRVGFRDVFRLTPIRHERGPYVREQRRDDEPPAMRTIGGLTIFTDADVAELARRNAKHHTTRRAA